jgi:subtilisin family serine protease
MKYHAISMAVLALCVGAAQTARGDELRRSYIVRLADKPVAGYTGGVAGLAATQPSYGKRLDLNSPDVKVYSAYLDQKRARVQSTLVNAPVSYDYKVVFNGFSAMLTDTEVRQLMASSDVAAVTANAMQHMETSYTPAFLGLDQPGGLWSQLGGKEHAGEDVVVGIIDGGIWPESLSYADRVDASGAPTFDASGTLAYGPAPASWKGECQTGEGFTSAHCNNKLIGAQYFDADFQRTGYTMHWSDFRSPRDSIGGTVGHGGHGTHTSSTAAGNNGVQAMVNGVPMGATSGMAPRARVAMYKICWTFNDDRDATGGTNACFEGDSVAAIEKAVSDGVNVINYSISGADTIDNPVEYAYLQAANAGVFVAVAGGNSGPDNTVAHNSPWLTTVAASTHDRQLAATVTLANGNKYSGASLNLNPLPATAMIRAEDAGLSGANAHQLSLCYSAASNGGLALLDPAKVAGKIVVCTRGEIARVEKSVAVLEAGGAGMVLVDDGGGPVADVHSVPTVHVNVNDGHLIQAYAKTVGAKGDISKFAATKGNVPAPVVAGFSSRGPNTFDLNVLKPDMAAPGVSVLAGVTPGMSAAQHDQISDGTLVPPAAWAFYDGTSMATPHVAGLAALLRQRHPDWSPAAIKSALMTSASSTKPDQQVGAAAGVLPWGQGAGHVTPNSAADPGLVYDLGENDYRKYACGTGVLQDLCGIGSIKGFELNLPSITVANVMGSQSVTRTVTNVGATAATYTAVASIPGYNVQVSPPMLTLGAGESRAFTVTLQRTDAPDNQWQFGQLVWSDGAHTVRSPMQARSVTAIVAPAQLKSDRISGMRTMSVVTGYTGKMTAALGGLKEVSRSSMTLPQAASGAADTLNQAIASCKTGSKGVYAMPVSIPANTVAARFETFNRDVQNGETGKQDVDLLMLDGSGALVDYSMHVGANESISLNSPPAGSYKLCLIGYELVNGAPAQLTLSSTIVGRSDVGGNLKVALPSKVYGGSTASIGLSWSGLASGKRYVGGVQLFDESGRLGGTTMLSVDTNNPVPLAAPVARTRKLNSDI